VAPSLTLAAVTTSPTSSTSLTFTLTGNENLDCSTISTTNGVDFTFGNISSIGPITGSGTTTCTIPATSSIGSGATGTSSLTRDGTFSVSDSVGNAQTAVAGSPASVVVDRQAPTVTTFSCGVPSGTTTNRPRSTARSPSASRSGFGSTTADVTIGGTSSAWTKGASAGSGAGPYTFTVSRGAPNTDGTLTIQVAAGAASDTAGNGSAASSTLSYTIDTNAPSVTIVSVVPDPTNSGTTVTWHADENGSFSVRIGSTDCTDGTEAASGTYSTSPSDVSTALGSSDLAEGPNGIRVCVTDTATNTGSATSSVSKDTAPPSSSASSPAYSTSTGITVTYSASDAGSPPSGLLKVELYAHTPNIAGYSLAGTDNDPNTTQSFSFTGTVDGSYDFYTVAYDSAGNIEAAPGSPDTSTLVDTQKPTSAASSPTYATSTTFTVTYTASDPLKNGSASLTECMPDTGSWRNCPSPQTPHRPGQRQPHRPAGPGRSMVAGQCRVDPRFVHPGGRQCVSAPERRGHLPGRTGGHGAEASPGCGLLAVPRRFLRHGQRPWFRAQPLR
jgi:hypothetical protein